MGSNKKETERLRFKKSFHKIIRIYVHIRTDMDNYLG